LNDYRQEVETKEIVDQLFRKILEGKILEDAELMLTFSPDFYFKCEKYSGKPMYSEDCKRLLFNCPWDINTSQETPFKVWSRL
jgi:hypothetical protein